MRPYYSVSSVHGTKSFVTLELARVYFNVVLGRVSKTIWLVTGDFSNSELIVQETYRKFEDVLEYRLEMINGERVYSHISNTI